MNPPLRDPIQARSAERGAQTIFQKKFRNRLKLWESGSIVIKKYCVASERNNHVRIMRRLPYATIREPQTSREALKIIGLLRNAGLHPAGLRSTTPLTFPGTKPRFPVKVCNEEAEAAKKLLRSLKK